MSYLPIDSALPSIIAALSEQPNLVIEAAPGAGKTTRVPPAILNSKISNGKEIWVLEPRRLAARLSAKRVAEERGEKLGETVGYQIRFEDVSSARTRLRFLTEGLLTRKLLADPKLKNVAVVILDEFHERNLHTDIALALLRQLQQTTRPDLKIAVMSATLDAQPIAAYLGNCNIIKVEGKQFQVALEYQGTSELQRLEVQVAAVTKSLITKGEVGDILVFLPGAADIRRSFSACSDFAAQQDIQLCMLHGELSSVEQDAALRLTGKRKIILSTNVAETSLTIEGVTAVIDSGLARVAGHSSWSGLPTLTTQRISKAGAIQRAGRAGRTAPGKCIRLFSEMDFSVRPDFEIPEILRSDLSTIILQLAGAGISDPLSFTWFDSPSHAAIQAAQTLLKELKAINSSGAITASGKKMLAYPLHPRQSKIFLQAAESGLSAAGAGLAALMNERSIENFKETSSHKNFHSDSLQAKSHLLNQLDLIHSFQQKRISENELEKRNVNANAVRQIIKTKQQLEKIGKAQGLEVNTEKLAGSILLNEERLSLAILSGFPDRVGAIQASDNATTSDRTIYTVKMCNGQSASVSISYRLAEKENFIVALDASEQRSSGAGRSVNALIRSFLPIRPDWLLDLFPEKIDEENRLVWNDKAERVEAFAALKYESLILDETRLNLSAQKKSAALTIQIQQLMMHSVLKAGWNKFISEDDIARLLARINFAAKFTPESFPPPIHQPDVIAALEQFCIGKSSFTELREIVNLTALTYAFLSSTQAQKLAEIAPDFVSIPGRKKVQVHYSETNDPWIESRLQDFFGLNISPAIANGRVPLVLHLLAPNHRPVQVTNDLAGFWIRTYPQIRRELSRRYPRHQWPENPLQFSSQLKK